MIVTCGNAAIGPAASVQVRLSAEWLRVIYLNLIKLIFRIVAVQRLNRQNPISSFLRVHFEDLVLAYTHILRMGNE